MALCPTHGQEFKLVPAGISKKTGNAYPAFFSCPERGCREKPGAAPTQRETFDDELNRSAAQMVNQKKDTTITRIAIAKSLIESGMKWGLDAQKEADHWLAWVENRQPMPKVVTQDDYELGN